MVTQESIEALMFRRAMGLLRHRPLIGSLMEDSMLRLLKAHDGWISEGLLYDEFMPKVYFSISGVAKLANAYDAWVDEMQVKYNLWTFIPTSWDYDVILCTDEKKRRAEENLYGLGRFVQA